jgi:hypothetical protein
MLLGEIAACIAAVAAAATCAFGILNRKNIAEVKDRVIDVRVQVDGQLSTVMDKLDVATGKIIVLESAAQHSYESRTVPGPVASVLQTPRTSEYPPGTLRPSETSDHPLASPQTDATSP